VSTTRQQARFAGVLYLLLALTAPLGLIYVPAQVIVSGDAVATAANVRSHEGLVHLGIASELLHQIICLYLTLALYRLFKPVNEARAREVVILGALLPVPIVFVNVLSEVAALTLANDGGAFAAFARPQLDALTYLFLHMHEQGISVAAIFWGLWLFPFGLLVIRSGFIPKPLGVVLLITGAGYLVNSVAALTLPSIAPMVERLTTPLTLGELPMVVWLLVWGARPQPVPVREAYVPGAGGGGGGGGGRD
jgi:hypothetical protein